MASVILDLTALRADGSDGSDGNFNTQLLDIVHGLPVNFHASLDPLSSGSDEALKYEFTGAYEHLLIVIDRSEPDVYARPGLIASIENIHS